MRGLAGGAEGRHRRSPSAVLWVAAIVGALVGIPVAALTLPVFDVVIALARGAEWTQAWQATSYTDEDLEMVPALLVAAVVFGVLCAVAGAGAWLLVMSRDVVRPRAARWCAAIASAGVPLVLLVVPNWPFALAIALPAAMLAAIGAPLVGYTRRGAQAVASA